MILDEANAIGTAHLRTSLLPEPHRSESRKLLREYVTLRSVEAGEDRIAEALPGRKCCTKLWSRAVEASQATSSPVFVSLYIQSLNEVIDLHSKRHHPRAQESDPRRHLGRTLFRLMRRAGRDGIPCGAGRDGTVAGGGGPGLDVLGGDRPDRRSRPSPGRTNAGRSIGHDHASENPLGDITLIAQVRPSSTPLPLSGWLGRRRTRRRPSGQALALPGGRLAARASTPATRSFIRPQRGPGSAVATPSRRR